jgi:hypothetical protein
MLNCREAELFSVYELVPKIIEEINLYNTY